MRGQPRTILLFFYLRCVVKNEDVYALMVHLWTALTPVAHSPYVKLGTWGPRGFLISPCLGKPHAERVENRGIINVSCSKGLAVIKVQLSSLRLEWVLFSWSAFLGGAKVANKEASLAPFYSCQGSFSPHGLCVALDKRHKLCSVISKFTNCPHTWKPTSYPKPQPTVGIFPNDFFLLKTTS